MGTCQSGTNYVSNSSFIGCAPCTPGKYSTFDAPSSVACSTCPTNTISGWGSALITDCSCLPGYKSNLDGHACVACPAGTEKKYGGIGVCSACGAGTYNAATGVADCFQCPVGTISDLASISLNDCRCKPGYTATADGVECAACGVGKYKAGVGIGGCSSCGWSRTTAVEGSSTSGNCICVAGLTGAACSGCVIGKYKDFLGPGDCVDCPSGTSSYVYSGTSYSEFGYSPSLDLCRCMPGYTQTSDGVECSACDAGSYKDDVGIGGCLQCPAGTYKVVAGAGSCSTCPVGKSSAPGSDELTDCTACDAGEYKVATGVGVCATCPAWTSSAPGSDKLTDCKCLAGYSGTSDGEVCNPCDAGEYKVATGVGVCATCPVGTSSTPGSDELTDCKCLAGYSGTSDGEVCNPCEAGKLKVMVGTGSCISCPAHTISAQGSDELADCICQAGYNGTPCGDCEMGTYKTTTGPADCTACPSNTTSDLASISLNDCRCKPGYTATADGVECSVCGEGSYKADVGIGVCTICPGGSTTGGIEGSSNISECLCNAGSTGPITTDGVSVCILCAAGEYKGTVGPASCSTCPSGTSTYVDLGTWGIVELGNKLSLDECMCKPGYTAASDGVECAACGVGSYKADVGIGVCNNCGWGWTTTIEDSSTIGDCLCSLGYTGTECNGCAIGKYKDFLGPGDCVDCPSGTTSYLDLGTSYSEFGYSPSLDRCKCMPGYTQTSDGVECSACNAGSYKDDVGIGGCLQCPDGTTSTSASTSLSDCKCNIGYTAGSDGVECTVCDAGTYKAVVGAVDCSTCPSGTFSGLGSDTLNDCMCLEGHTATSNGQICTACVVGTYKEVVGAVDCSTCPSGTFSVLGSDALNDCICLKGHTATSNGQICTACDAGTYKFWEGVGTESCNGCPAGEYSVGLGNIWCTVCSEGTFSAGTGNTACSMCQGRNVWTNDTGCQCEKGYVSSDGDPDSGVCDICDIGYEDMVPAIACGGSCCYSGWLEPGGLISDGVGDYGNNAWCWWIIEGLQSDDLPSVTFTSFSIEPNHDKVYVEESEDASFSSGVVQLAYMSGDGGISGSYNSVTHTATKRYMRVRFTSNEYATFEGFTATWSPSSNWVCSACEEEGTHKTLVGPGSCVEGEKGYTLGSNGVYEQCAAATYKPSIGTGSCTNCPVWSTSPPGSRDLIDCKCLDGSVNLGSCECLPGSTRNAQWWVDCMPCEAGTFKNFYGDDSCLTCPGIDKGSLSGSEELTDCRCNAGYTVESNGVDCTMCDAGKYKNTTGSVSCTSCPSNTNSTRGGDDLADCKCVAGYSATFDGEACTACSTGTYKDGIGAVECSSCPTGTSSASGSDELTDCTCLTGYNGTSDGAACTACDAGEYKVATGVGVCPTCPVGTSSAPGSDELTDCKCLAGYSATSDGVACTACDAGEYKVATGAGVCSTCPVGTSSAPGSDELTDCTCLVGYHGTSDGTACTACDSDEYKSATGVGVCSTCPAGTSSASGSDELTDCTCLVGYHGTSDGAACTACDSDEYKSATGVGVCSTCPAGTRSASGSDELTDCTCLTGYHGTSDGAACTACDAGEYKVATGVGVCSTCPVGTSSASGSDELTDCKCVPGYTVVSDGMACVACNEGTYKVATGIGQCSTCPVGTNSAVASDELTDCKCNAGYTVESNGVDCTMCDAGKYKNTTGSVSCTSCPSNTNSTRGSDDLAQCVCPLGHTTASDGLSCTLCDVGKYNDAAGASCSDCPNGTISASGSDELTDCTCLVGYTATSNGTVCTPCGAGTYNEDIGPEVCTPCPAGAYKTVVGVGLCVKCERGSFWGETEVAPNTALSVPHDAENVTGDWGVSPAYSRTACTAAVETAVEMPADCLAGAPGVPVLYNSALEPEVQSSFPFYCTGETNVSFSGYVKFNTSDSYTHPIRAKTETLDWVDMYPILVDDTLYSDIVLVAQDGSPVPGGHTQYVMEDSVSGDLYMVHKFMHTGSFASDTMNVQTSYEINFPTTTTIDVLVVGGGGSGGTCSGSACGGSGSGGQVNNYTRDVQGSHTLLVGAGGQGENKATNGNLYENGNEGSDSVFGTDDACIGGGGGGWGNRPTGSRSPLLNADMSAGTSGAYGGGAGALKSGVGSATTAGSLGLVAYSGGGGISISTGGGKAFCGGGGGAAGVGYTIYDGLGGAGHYIDAFGVAVGGGGFPQQRYGGVCNGELSLYGGGWRCPTFNDEGDGASGTGGGGVGASGNSNPLAGSGGSGVIMLRYRIKREVKWSPVPPLFAMTVAATGDPGGHTQYMEKDSVSGDLYMVHKFTHTGGTRTGGTEVQTQYTMSFPEQTIIDMLVVGGGAGGGGTEGSCQCGAGGGSGGEYNMVLQRNVSGEHIIVVGAGGIRGTANGNGYVGSTSAFDATDISIGGGGGGRAKYNTRRTGSQGAYGGGSGCGAKNDNSEGISPAVCGVADPSICGGDGHWKQYVGSGGGGGGCGGSGGDAINARGGGGGLGLHVLEFSVDVCGGGAGSTRYCALSDATHGGGIGGPTTDAFYPDGVASTGGGGAGAGQNCNLAGDGGSGLVMIRYRIAKSFWATAVQPLFAPAGPHTLTVGASAGSASISHIRFVEGNASCYFYTDGEPSTAVCTRCPMEQEAVAPQTDASSCQACAVVGLVFDESVKECTCLAGYGKVSTGALCTPCAQGTYKEDIGPDMCTPCPAGTYKTAVGVGLCTPCARGTYKEFIGTEMCTPCPANTATKSTGNDEILDCVCIAGYTGADWTECTQCNVGTYKHDMGSAACSSCPADSSSVSGSPNCTCVADTYMDITGAATCSACPAGTSSLLGSDELTDCKCLPGYGGTSDGEVCTMCDAGTFKSAAGIGVCEMCMLHSSATVDHSGCTCNEDYILDADGACVISSEILNRAAGETCGCP